MAPLHKLLELPSQMERKLLIEDFNEVHRHSIEQAMVTLIRDSGRPFDFFKDHIKISCSYRRDSGGNPATAFRLDAMTVQRDPPSNSAYYRTFRDTMTEPDREMHDQIGYMGAVMTNCESLAIFFRTLILNRSHRSIRSADHVDDMHISHCAQPRHSKVPQDAECRRIALAGSSEVFRGEGSSLPCCIALRTVLASWFDREEGKQMGMENEVHRRLEAAGYQINLPCASRFRPECADSVVP